MFLKNKKDMYSGKYLIIPYVEKYENLRILQIGVASTSKTVSYDISVFINNSKVVIIVVDSHGSVAQTFTIGFVFRRVPAVDYFAFMVWCVTFIIRVIFWSVGFNLIFGAC